MITFELTYVLGILALAIFALAIALLIYTEKNSDLIVLINSFSN